MKTFTLSDIHALDPQFDPTKFSRIPAPGEDVTRWYSVGFIGLKPNHAAFEASARELIRQSLEKRHGKPVISLHEYENLRGVASLDTYRKVQNHQVIVL